MYQPTVGFLRLSPSDCFRLSVAIQQVGIAKHNRIAVAIGQSKQHKYLLKAVITELSCRSPSPLQEQHAVRSAVLCCTSYKANYVRYLCLLLQVIDLRHVVSVLVLALCDIAFQLGGVVLVCLQVLQAQPELLHFSCLLSPELAHLLQSLHRPLRTLLRRSHVRSKHQ